LTGPAAPRLLLTNDDGVDAPGMALLRELAAKLSDDVWVVAPDGNQSGAGHRFTFGRELRLDERAPRVFAVHGGSPADCVVAGCTHVLADRPPDIVLSGVNNGQNLGDIVHCSGTAAGAREGALQGALGIALSQGVDYERGREVVWEVARTHGEAVLRSLIAAVSPELAGRVYFNVNFPACRPGQVEGVRLVEAQRFSRSPMRYYPSDNPGHFFIAIPHDFHVLHHDRTITVTPIGLRLTDVEALEQLRGTVTLA
jgi:5'-nucleotidase